MASQPAYSYFVRASSLVYVNQTAPTNNLDIYNNVNTLPAGMQVILRLQITVAETYANLLKRKLHRAEVQFTSGVGTIVDCWANDNVYSYYNMDT